ncbi:hypothetical protein AXE80_02890 [Wenyingzhuangia fucanilytica]|uniref:histidine kinase n=1 Tax=Wenyingzhuangia fucanilytica TaxID=1790137 RepID=A0A1B1Y3E5_9FLAO|nr:ATP-binding protein [Wenyingzhuangia fucanilytica]ANW95295.1 hypothetical protein AXE80_02890 [Wenyingzhuangia fucanilytica]
MFIKFLTTSLILALSAFNIVIAQPNVLKSKQNLTISDGLAHNGVTSLIEDSYGYLWIGTYDGLNRYDGYNLKTYKNTLEEDILVSNRVRTISEDSKSNLWIGTDNGISIYNQNTEKFKSLYPNKQNKLASTKSIVRKILFNEQTGIVVCATEGDGLLLFKKNQEFINKYIPSKKTYSKSVLFFDGINLDKDNYLFATSVGLLIFNTETKMFQRVLDDEVNYCNAVLKIDNQNLLLILKRGVAFVGYKSDNNIYKFKISHKALGSDNYKSASIDTLGNLWLGSLKNGLIHIDNMNLLKENKPYKLSFYKPKKGLLRSSTILAGHKNICWYGTFNTGLLRFDVKENPFKSYNIEMDYEYGIHSNKATSVSPLDDHRVYLASYLSQDHGGGLALFNTDSQKFEPLPFDISKKELDYIRSVFVDKDNNTWLKSSMYDLQLVRAGGSKIEGINDERLHGITLFSTTEDRYGNLWIAGGKGIVKIKKLKNGDIKEIEILKDNPYFKNNDLLYPRYIYADPLHDFVWIGTDKDGLFRINAEKDLPLNQAKVRQFVSNKKVDLSISSNFVTSILRLPNDELWIGTEGGGICKVIDSDTNPKFIPYSEKHGLSNNVVKSIQYDDSQNLWISTNIGLNKLDTKEMRFQNFDLSDGVPFDDFSFASTKLKNGYMLFSGLDGFCYFSPKDLLDHDALPTLEFDEVRLFNEIILPGDTIANRVLYNKRLTDQDELKFRYNENFFSIKLTSLHFSNPDNHHLKYRLMPINKDWIEMPSHQQTISYNGLQSGEYDLEVMASNAMGKWTEPKVLKIKILPPFWKTDYAYLLYFLFAILFVYIVVKIFSRIQALQYNLKIEQLEKNQAEQINAEKLRFFSNISHELKTPITLILEPVKMLLKQFKNNSEIQEKLNIVKRQSKKLNHLISQVHDFQKAEAKVLKMNYSRFCFNEFVEELIIDFNFLAKNDNKTLEVISSKNNIVVSADCDKLEKIFNNVLSNAFKYTKENDTIKVEYSVSGKDLEVCISDTGKGIDSEDLAHVFERFYQSHKQDNVYASGSGIGLAFAKLLVEMHYGYIMAESELGKGTRIKIRLPIVKQETAKNQPKVEKVMLMAEKGFEFETQLLPQNNPSNIEIDVNFSDALIFYAEDNSDMRNYVSKTLSKYYKLKTFSNGQECLDAMEDEWPDIVISDVQMPELNGMDLCRKIKSEIKTSHIPVILLTALTNIEDKIKGIRDGADAYIKKPFNLQLLITRTETLLNNRKQLRERFQIGIPLSKENNLNNRNDNAFLEKFYNIIEENLDNQDLNLNDLTKELYLNRTHFYQKVKALTNLTPFEVIKEYRLKKAAGFLVQKDVSITEVCIMTGFKSRSHFSRLFKEQYGIAPSKYVSDLKEKYKSS